MHAYFASLSQLSIEAMGHHPYPPSLGSAPYLALSPVALCSPTVAPITLYCVFVNLANLLLPHFPTVSALKAETLFYFHQVRFAFLLISGWSIICTVAGT